MGKEGVHIPYIEGKTLTGTARYCSLATHMGLEQSRRDDLESVGHVLLYFLKGGNLPWMGLPGATKKEKYENVKKRMFETTFAELCQGLPVEFMQYMGHCRQLKFEETPNYDYLVNLLSKCYDRYHLLEKPNANQAVKMALNQQVYNVLPESLTSGAPHLLGLKKLRSFHELK